MTEYWVHEIVGVTSVVVAVFDTEANAHEWAAAEFETVHDPYPTRATSGAFIVAVERFD